MRIRNSFESDSSKAADGETQQYGLILKVSEIDLEKPKRSGAVEHIGMAVVLVSRA